LCAIRRHSDVDVIEPVVGSFAFDSIDSLPRATPNLARAIFIQRLYARTSGALTGMIDNEHLISVVVVWSFRSPLRVEATQTFEGGDPIFTITRLQEVRYIVVRQPLSSCVIDKAKSVEA